MKVFDEQGNCIIDSTKGQTLILYFEDEGTRKLVGRHISNMEPGARIYATYEPTLFPSLSMKHLAQMIIRENG